MRATSLSPSIFSGRMRGAGMSRVETEREYGMDEVV